jgi:hypothetical protein
MVCCHRLCCELSVLAHVHFHVLCVFSRVTRFENFYAETLTFLCYILFESHPPVVRNNFRKCWKFGKVVIYNFKQVSNLGCSAVSLKMLNPCHTFRKSVNRTEIAWYWNHRYQCQETIQIFRWLWPLAVLTHYSTHTQIHIHTHIQTPTVICLLRRNYKLSIQQPELWGPSKKQGI